MRIQVIIPARYRSSRLPGKPLVDILGVPMLERTWRQCRKAVSDEDLLIATDDERIADHCRKVGMRFVMTSPDCLTGTDRVAEVARSVDADYFVNVQGDEPLIDPEDIRALIEAAHRHPDEVLLGITEIEDEDQFRNPSITKAVFRKDMRLLYVSRGAIPVTKRGEFRRAWRPIYVYGFPPPALAAFRGTGAKATLEEIEDVEILRLLELGFEIRLVPMSSSSIPVDMPEDVARVEQYLRTHGDT